jgi:hypothetical protein
VRQLNISTFDKYYIVPYLKIKWSVLENGTNVLKDEYQFYNNYDKTIFLLQQIKNMISIEDKFSQTDIG